MYVCHGRTLGCGAKVGGNVSARVGETDQPC